MKYLEVDSFLMPCHRPGTSQNQHRHRQECCLRAESGGRTGRGSFIFLHQGRNGSDMHQGGNGPDTHRDGNGSDTHQDGNGSDILGSYLDV